MSDQSPISTCPLKPRGRDSYQNNPSVETSNDSEDAIPDTSGESSEESDDVAETQHSIRRANAISMHMIPECDTRAQFSDAKQPSLRLWCIGPVALIIGIAAIYCKSSALQSTRCDPSGLRKFSEEIQLAVEAALDETNRFRKPSVLTFIYNQQQLESQVDNDLQLIINYTTCKLHGGSEFVEVTSDDVHNPAVLSDRGKLISKFSLPLKQRKVMLVKHLEDVPPSVAVAFHYFCDQQSPIVDHALVIFTLKHNAASNDASEFRVVENVLTERWSELKVDFIPPLMARIANAIMRI